MYPVLSVSKFSQDVIVALIAAVPPMFAVVVAFIALWKGQRAMHIIMNSRLSKLLRLTKKSALAEGKEDERLRNNRGNISRRKVIRVVRAKK